MWVLWCSWSASGLPRATQDARKQKLEEYEQRIPHDEGQMVSQTGWITWHFSSSWKPNTVFFGLSTLLLSLTFSVRISTGRSRSQTSKKGTKKRTRGGWKLSHLKGNALCCRLYFNNARLYSHSHASSNARVCCVCPVLPLVLMARAPRAAQDARKHKLEERDKRLRTVEEEFTGLRNQLDNLELRVEMETSYRFLRVEHSPALNNLFRQVEQGEVQQGKRWQEKFGRFWKVQSKKQPWWQKAVNCPEEDAAGQPQRNVWLCWTHGGLERHVEWVSKQGTHAYSVRLQQGEPSRLCTDQVRKVLNWTLYVYGKCLEGSVQVFPDRGPKQRAKGN